MGKLERPVILDAVAVILFHKWQSWGLLCSRLGQDLCVVQTAASESQYYLDSRNRKMRINWQRWNASTVPRLLTMDDLDEQQRLDYLKHVAALQGADAGERHTFAMAWVLGYDVCSRDNQAQVFFARNKPTGCESRFLDVMALLRQAGLVDK